MGQKSSKNNNLMGPVKAALESTVRNLAMELGCKRIRVNVISPEPIHTRAASGLADFDFLMEKAIKESPIQQLIPLRQSVKWLLFLCLIRRNTLLAKSYMLMRL